MSREHMEYDVVIVGAGPAGLSAAIRLAQLSQTNPLRICLLEKASEVGGHILSGAIFEPRALNELIPDWSTRGAPLHTPVKQDRFCYLTQHRAWTLPTPPSMHNAGNYIISLGLLCRWLATQAEALGVEIYPGFAATEILYNNDRVIGVATGDKGLDKAGTPTAQHQPGIELRAKYTLFAEGCRGSLSQLLMDRYSLRQTADPQTYGIGIKELWEIDPEKHQPGTIFHSVGWPLETDTYGGSFLYHLNNNQVAIGFVVGLDYRNPYLSPYEEFQRFKTHPAIRETLLGGRRLSYGARALNEGGYQSIPQLTFPGGLLIGCSAGFLNVPKLKGSHTAMKSGMLAAEACFQALGTTPSPVEVTEYPRLLQTSWVWEELYQARNIRPAFRQGLWAGLAWGALDSYLFRGRAPWTWHHHPDHQQLHPKTDAKPIAYPKPDGVVSFDRLSSVFLSNTHHREDEPVHLKLKDPTLATAVNLAQYDSPEQRYCPAGVYEIVTLEAQPRLQINAQNCIHCKTCDIKDPKQNIQWVPPEGGEGPNYSAM